MLLLSHDLLCGTIYNGKVAKIYCKVEQDDCAAIKLLNNQSGQLYEFKVHVNLDTRSGKRVLCEGCCEKLQGTDSDLLNRHCEKLNDRKRNFLLYLVLFDELLLRNNNSYLFPSQTEMSFL